MFGMSAVIVLLFYVFSLYVGTDPIATMVVGAVFSIVYSLISFYASDRVALMSSGAKQIRKQDSPELWNMVENLSITAGIPMPKVYVINDEAPNAFATGRDPKHASVAFTTGILKLMNRQELEGVTAHELSHIKNYDIRVMTVTVVLVGLIVLIADIFLRIGLFRNGDRRGGGQAAAVLIVVGIVLAIISPLIAQVIKLAISRTREYLADSSGALLTRYPEGLASALEKLGQYSGKLKKANHATAHLFISNPFGEKRGQKVGFFERLFRTHPPISERIAKLRAM